MLISRGDLSGGADLQVLLSGKRQIDPAYGTIQYVDTKTLAWSKSSLESQVPGTIELVLASILPSQCSVLVNEKKRTCCDRYQTCHRSS